jgi:hypothetical protein
LVAGQKLHRVQPPPQKMSMRMAIAVIVVAIAIGLAYGMIAHLLF